jgi:TPR repeat protein
MICHGVGAMYSRRHGVVRDLVHAYAWRNLAASQGNEISIKARDALESDLTSAELAEGQRLASKWKKGEIIRR